MEKNTFFFLQNDEIGLKRIEETDDLSNYHKWFNDQEVNEFNSHCVYPMTLAAIKKYIVTIVRDNLHLSIFIKKNNIHIGNVSLQAIDYHNRSAEFAIIMGEKEHWGKGYSYAAGRMIIDHAFDKMNLRRIYCGTSELNIGMQKLALKLGMKEEGRRKEAMFHKGGYVDMLEYGIVKL